MSRNHAIPSIHLREYLKNLKKAFEVILQFD